MDSELEWRPKKDGLCFLADVPKAERDSLFLSVESKNKISVKNPDLKHLRLVRKSEFEILWKKGRRKPLTPWLQLVYRKNDLGHLRFGISLSRKTGTAVVRNKLRRWTREILRSELKKTPGSEIKAEGKTEVKKVKALGGWDIHFIFRSPKPGFFKELSFVEYQKPVLQSLDFIRNLD